MVRLLDELRETRGLPKTFVLDNGPEMTSEAMFFSSRQHGVKLHFIQPDKPRTGKDHDQRFPGQVLWKGLDRLDEGIS